MLAKTLLTISGLVLGTAGYVLQDDYTAQNFFSMFDFFTASDPTHGYVNYVDQSAAASSNLINTNNGAVYMGVDSSNVASGRGRNSVRITSKASYNQGLVILDLAHMPSSACGSWPAFWMVGPNWPNSGEIDIIEGVNAQIGNSMALHTSSGCSISNTSLFSGQIETPNCDVNAAGQAANSGCGITTSAASSYGDGFNAAQGGVYATEWTSEAISIWYFPRSSIPTDVSSGWPNPNSWGTPLASFSGSCDIDSHFKNLQIVFDVTFCGDWAGAVFSSDASCSAKASTCQEYVQNNPKAFAESYWSINGLKVYSGSGGRPEVTASPPIPIPIPTASQGIPTSWPANTGSAWPTFAPTASSQEDGQTWGIGRDDGQTKTWSAVDQGQFYQASPTTDAADASTTQAAVPTEATPAAPPAAPTPEGTNPEAPVKIVADAAGAVEEASTASTPTAATMTVSLGHADGRDSNVKYVTVTAMMNDDFPREKREGSEEEENRRLEEQKRAESEGENVQKRHVHRHMLEHKRQWERRGAWRR